MPRVPKPTWRTPPLTVTGVVQVKGVHFQYGEFDAPLLQGVDLAIAPGQFVAIVGPSGCGKSSLLKLMLGLYPPSKGQIFLEGQIATPALWRAWREQVGVVAQDDRLLSGSITENIAFFDPDLNMERVQRAAIAANIHAEIVRMPMQYQSLVGDMGSVLSGGQRQRVLLARALYRDPKVLILDEGTANLDQDNERLIADVVASLPITRIVIAHRSEMLKHASCIYVMNEGKLTRHGGIAGS